MAIKYDGIFTSYQENANILFLPSDWNRLKRVTIFN